MLSRCSKHAANLSLTKQAGKQEAKEDDEKPEAEMHENPVASGTRPVRPEMKTA
jgi:hypothetical protein